MASSVEPPRQPVSQPVTQRPVVHDVPHDAEVKNLIQWGPIVAGVITTVAVMLVLTILGLALGAAVFEPREPGQNIGAWAGIWGAISAIVAFFLGGLVAANTASVPGKDSALMNGFLVGAATLVLGLYMIGAGMGNLFGVLGGNLGDIANVVQEQAAEEDVTADDAQEAVDDVVEDVQTTLDDAFDNVSDAAWGTLGGILLALGASTLGGVVGVNSRRDLDERAAV